MGLDRETVVREALEQLDEVGLEGLTLRRIAKTLGVQAPALYWHFRNKQELLDEMATVMLRDLLGSAQATGPAGAGVAAHDADDEDDEDDDEDVPWDEWIAASARGLRGMLRG